MSKITRGRALGVFFLLLLTLAAYASPPPPSVTLPDSGTYAYWVQAKTGTVSAMPTTITGHPQIMLPGSPGSGGTLYVLDKHNGSIAVLPLSGSSGPQALSVGDFKPLLPLSAAPSPAATPPAAARPVAPAPEAGNGFLRLLTVLFGLLVAGGVVWVILRLIQLRGQPLIAAARKLGVDVPDPVTADAEPEAAPVYTPPAPRPVEKVPDEAGTPPPTPPAPPRPVTVGTLDAPQIVGIQGLAAGSSFTVPRQEVFIGRDGDNGIVLAESTVSRRHARIGRDGDGRITLTDEDSANGVYVNGQRITQAILAPGDQIQIGDSYFRLEA